MMHSEALLATTQTKRENNMTTSQPTKTEVVLAKEFLHNFLVGYGRKDPEALKELLLANNWKQHAKDELEHRLTKFITLWDINTLNAMAKGSIDIREAIDTAYNTFTGLK
jgi:hypothetical protein